MSLVVANTIGLVGSALMVIAYAYSNLAARLDYLLFNLLNLVGSLMLLASLAVSFNLASFLLEVVWAAIALLGAVRALVRRRAA